MAEEKSKVTIAVIQALAIILSAVIGAVVGPVVIKCIGGDCGTKPNSLAVEEIIPQNVFVFTGNNNPDGGWGAFSLVYDDKHIPNYRMEYSIPEDKNGYAGMVFQFPKGQNLSAFKAVEFAIMFNMPSDEIDLFIKDISENNNRIHIAGNGARELNLTYEFTNFPDINFNAVMEIGIFANEDFARGSHEVRIKDLRFVK